MDYLKLKGKMILVLLLFDLTRHIFSILGLLHCCFQMFYLLPDLGGAVTIRCPFSPIAYDTSSLSASGENAF